MLMKKAAEDGFGPSVLYNSEHYILMDFLDAAQLSTKIIESNPKVLIQLIGHIRRYHQWQGRWDTFDPHSQILVYYKRAYDAKVQMADAKVERVLNLLPHFLKSLRSEGRLPVLSHIDLHSGNVLIHKGNEKVGIIDWENAGRFDPYYDLASVVHSFRLDDAFLEKILALYHQEPVSQSAIESLKRMTAIVKLWDVFWFYAHAPDLEFNEELSNKIENYLEAALLVME